MLTPMTGLHKFALATLLLFNVAAEALADEIMVGMGYDRAHDGHGFDLHKVGERWVLYFYTYDESGQPEWYLGIGEMQFETIQGEFLLITYDPRGNSSANGGPGVFRSILSGFQRAGFSQCL